MDDSKLIAEVRNRPFLWDKLDKRYSHRELTSTAWDAIAKEMGGDVTTSECKNRWTNIKDYFLRKDKEIRFLNSSQDTIKKKKKKWHLYDSLLFLASAASSASVSGNPPSIGDDSNLYAFEVKDQSQLKISSSPTSVQSEASFASEGRETQLHTVPELSRKRKVANSQEMSEIDRTIKKGLMEPGKTNLDENEHFFKSILSPLKNLDEVETMQFRLDVQKLVLEYLLKARARKMTVPSSHFHPKSNLSHSPPQRNSTASHNTNGTFQTSSEDSTHDSRQNAFYSQANLTGNACIKD